MIHIYSRIVYPVSQKDSHQIHKYIGQKPRGRPPLRASQVMCRIHSSKPESGSGTRSTQGECAVSVFSPTI